MEKTMLDIREFEIYSIRFEVSFINKTKYRDKKRNNSMDGGLQYLQMAGMQLI